MRKFATGIKIDYHQTFMHRLLLRFVIADSSLLDFG